jgi:hypothetical protein
MVDEDDFAVFFEPAVVRAKPVMDIFSRRLAAGILARSLIEFTRYTYPKYEACCSCRRPRA